MPRPGFPGPLGCRREVGHSWTPRLCSLSQAKSRGLDCWGPMLRTRAGLGTPISDARWSECSGGVSRPLFSSRSGGRLSLCFPMQRKEGPSVQAARAEFSGEGWRSSPSAPRVVPASAAASALLALITVDMALWRGGATPLPPRSRAVCGTNPQHSN